MSAVDSRRLRLLLLQNAPLILFLVLVAVFGSMSDRFLSPTNFMNIVTQAAHIAIIAIGMTFVLLVAGIDLSVGANMYASCIVVALYMKGWNPVFGFTVAAVLGLAFGAVNAFVITRLRVPAFIATLATLFVGRAIGLYLSGVKMIPFGKEILLLGRTTWLGLPVPIWIFLVVFLVALVTLRLTTFGRQVYAVGADPEAAGKAGIDVRKILFAVYCIAGACAAIGGLVSASQVAAASSTFGFQKEFPVIAAAVLGGTSLFGGRGGVIGTVFGAILIQTVENGLVMINADPYVYPLVVSAIIFLAVLVDSLRTDMLERLERRKIRVEAA
ncbi:ABC transporter permease [Geminicoccus roseus]|uniref:ABC transporter permease n=1 Tax=Geminicoccus roseus TaxID=404900 RepID=UPI000423F22B|nr:ABC transporter permease [Geminicoccus roseus]